jgi:hypothetical protein
LKTFIEKYVNRTTTDYGLLSLFFLPPHPAHPYYFLA